MTDKVTAETPMPFPSIPTPTSARTEVGPRSYEDVVRLTVPLPDSSYRPTTAEEAAAMTPPAADAASSRAPSSSDDRVRVVLARLDHADTADVSVALFGGTAIITGSVARGLDRDRIITALGTIAEITTVVDELRIRTE